MKFWDSSALVPLIVEEETSKACRAMLRADPTVLVWALTRVEIVSALWRRHREGSLDTAGVRQAESRLDTLASRWTEVDAVTPVREIAERLIRVHGLRAADSLQLAACIAVFAPHARGRQFVTADVLLARAGEAEGFNVVIPSASP